MRQENSTALLAEKDELILAQRTGVRVGGGHDGDGYAMGEKTKERKSQLSPARTISMVPSNQSTLYHVITATDPLEKEKRGTHLASWTQRYRDSSR